MRQMRTIATLRDEEKRVLAKRQVVVAGVLAALFLALLSLVGGSSVFAGSCPHVKKPAYVPPEAYEACKEKLEGDAVTVKVRRGLLNREIKAVCCQFTDEKQLMAVPEFMTNQAGKVK
jgi:hypothetical protein